MRLAFDRAHSVLDGHRLPGQSILDATEAGLEEGVKHLSPVKVKLTPLANVCEFRDRIRLLWVAHEFMKIRRPLNVAINRKRLT